MAIAIRKIIALLHPRRAGARKPPSRWRRLKYLLYPVLALILITLTLSWYYYNTFISLAYDVEEAKAQIDTQLQRRKNILLNLATMVEDYAKHERLIFKDIAEIRAALMGAKREPAPAHTKSFSPAPLKAAGQPPQAPANAPSPRNRSGEPKPGLKFPPGTPATSSKTPPAPGTKAPTDKPAPRAVPSRKPPRAARQNVKAPSLPASPADIGQVAGNIDAFSKIFAFAERYPSLKLNENFQSFMDALIDAENKIAEQRMLYNIRANKMSTVISKVPGYAFAKLYGFTSPPFFESESAARTSPQVKY